MNNKSIAIVLLLFSAAIFSYIIYYSMTGFWWELLQSFCGAAMVGGVADWFAIHVLFNKMKFVEHSDILRKKRKDLTVAIIDFATKDLLNINNIKQEIDKTYFSKLLSQYIKVYGGMNTIRRTVQTAVKSILEQTDLCGIIKKIEPDIRRCLEEGTIERLIPKIGLMITDSKHTADLFRTIINLGKIIYNQPEFQSLLQVHIKKLGENYDKKSFGRESIRSVALNNEDIMNALNTFVNDKLDELSTNSKQFYDDFRYSMKEFIGSEEFIKLLVEKKEDLLADDELIGWIYKKVDYFQRMNRLEMIQMADNLVVWGLEEFVSNKEWQRSFDDFTRRQLNINLVENHGNLAEIIAEELDKKTDDEMVEIVKDAAGDDIHSIRISGSIVGGIIGSSLFLIKFILIMLWGVIA